MEQKELLAPLFLKNEKAVCGWKDHRIFHGGDPVELAKSYDNAGADAVVVFDLSSGDKEHDGAVGMIKEIAGAVDIPIYGGGNIRRMEDVKKLIYAGCRKVFLNYGKEGNIELTEEVSARFGKEKILACVRENAELEAAKKRERFLGGILCLELPEAYFSGAVQTPQPDENLSGAVQIPQPDKTLSETQQTPQPGEDSSETQRGPRQTGSYQAADVPLPAYRMLESCRGEQAEAALRSNGTAGICVTAFMDPAYDIMETKHSLKEKGIPVNTYESALSWEDLKVNGDGLVPVVVQDYKTQEVLMVAYMNQEAFEYTVRTGRMTYWSRSRGELWVKGLTSGHFQYVKQLLIDCDNDTLLAKVSQVGAACHTGNRSCFYRSILKKEYDETNPLKVFEDVFAVIQDRKIHPREGSYTNYLFDKGIDKILKKVGEEATEIVIAAKNPDPEEIKYEISDFLYHVMVLMAERGVSWEDITKELARR